MSHGRTTKQQDHFTFIDHSSGGLQIEINLSKILNENFHHLSTKSTEGNRDIPFTQGFTHGHIFWSFSIFNIHSFEYAQVEIYCHQELSH